LEPALEYFDSSLNEISHDPYLFSVSNYMQSAWLGHAPFLKFLIREQKPSLFVELGVHNGFSYFVGCQSIRECSLNSKSFAIDHWEGDQQAGLFEDSVYQGVMSLNTKYSDFSTLLKMSFAEALKIFKDQTIDLLHIDGFHSYEAIKEDFETWLPKVSPNGIILLHDIHVRRNTFGVYKFWREIKSQFKTIEFVGSHGLGVVFLGEVPVGKLDELVRRSLDGELAQIQGTFGSITDDVVQNAKSVELLGALAERDSALAERDSALAERDSALAERDSVLNSTIWKISKPYRSLKGKL
jgi:hypothetical protein